MNVPFLRGHVAGCLASVALILVALPPSGALAATRAEQQSLLEKSLSHPSDYATAFAYARVSQDLGDYEAAIGALERLLFYNPRLTRVKYELGALYYQAHSYQLAVHYFNDALASADLDAATKARILAALPEAKKQASPVRSWVFVQSGVRYQSNATSTPPDGTVLLGSVPPQPHSPDWNAFELAEFANESDFGGQSDNRLETNVTGYYSEQFKFNALNVGLLSGSIGPRLALAPDKWPGLTIKPYATGSAAWVGGDPYVADAGAGVSLSAPFGSGLVVSPSVEWQHAAYTADPGATLGTANWLTTGLAVAAHMTDDLSVNASITYRRAGDAANAWQAYDAVWGEIGFALRFAPPIDTIAQKWTLAPFVRLSNTSFDAPDPSIAPGITRNDHKWQVGAALDAPLTDHLGLSLAATYERVDSSIPNYSYDNWSILFGPTARF